MNPRLVIEHLKPEHLDALALELLHSSVVEHIEDHLPSLEEFKLGLSRAIAGPPTCRTGEVWLNYLVRHANTNGMLGRLEATVHNGIAEVAFVFGPTHWGKGYAAEGLSWLQAEVQRTCGVWSFWATTVPSNLRCRSLLLRSGYAQVGKPFPALLSYEPGDLVFSYQSAV